MRLCTRGSFYSGRRWAAVFALLTAAVGWGGKGSAEAQTFSNTTNIRIPSAGTGPGPASPYPSTIVVSGLTQPVGDVTVGILGLSHTFPADIGILLVGPGGQSVLLMANAGANCNLAGIDLTFADGAPPLPDACIAPGRYSPTRYRTPAFPSPAPPPPFGNALSIFGGTSGNGTWSLFVIDDASLDSGAIAGGWSITFTAPKVTYQGRLNRNDAPLNAPADFMFTLFSTSTGGTALGAVALDAVNVHDGLFTVELPFNPSLLDGAPRWLEILVRSPAGSGSFDLLSPRQPINCAPQALHARTAGLATAALSAQSATSADTAVTASTAISADRATTADTASFSTSSGSAALATAATRLDAPDGSPTAAVFVGNDGSVGIGSLAPSNSLTVGGNADFAGSVGIGTASPARRLHVSNGASGGASQPTAELLVEDNSTCYINMMAPDASEHGLSFGSPAGSIHGGIYYTNTVGMDVRTGNNLSRGTINALGNVGIGVGVSGGTIDAKLHASAAGRVAKFDRTGSDGELIAFSRDDGVVGNITVAAGVVSYNAFTGSHWAWMDDAPERGMLVSMTGHNRRAGSVPGEGEVIYGAQLTAAANDPACLGAYLAPAESLSDGTARDGHQIMAVGNGEMWVVNTGRDIQPGDYLISSDTPGCAMLDDAARFPVGNVIARAAETVHWKSAPAAQGQRPCRISVLFGSFARTGPAAGPERVPGGTPAPDESLQARVRTLEAQNAALGERLELIEKRLTSSLQAK
jgi:hypothetical protein